MSDQQADTPVEYQDSTQDTTPDTTQDSGSTGSGHPSVGKPTSTGGPDAPPVVHQPALGHEHERHDGPDQTEGNLVQLPEGATFGSEGEPSAADRERLAGFAAGVEREMQREEETPATPE